MSGMSEFPDETLDALQARLGLAFEDRSLLEQALTHGSYRPDAPSSPSRSSRRLEFLGDALLDGIVAAHLHLTHPDWSTARLTRAKAAAVSGSTLARVAREVGLGDFLLLGKGEDDSGGRGRSPILAGALEALIAAVFLDNRDRRVPHHDTIGTWQFVLRILAPALDSAAPQGGPRAAGDPSRAAPEARPADRPQPPGLDRLEERLGLHIQPRLLLERALTHNSCPLPEAHPARPSHARLKFLGHSMLAAHVAILLHFARPEWSGSRLARAKGDLISKPALGRIARGLGLGDFLLLGKSEEQAGGRSRPSLLADALEALVGAVFLSGIESDFSRFATPTFVLQALEPSLLAIGDGRSDDPKGRLQELTQEVYHARPLYRVLSESGPDHEKTFVIEALMGNRRVGLGEGRTKKQAEQAAAGQALADWARMLAESAPASA
jgi:ribonuclease-3